MTLESEAHFRNYFFRSLRNLAVSALREAGRKKTSALDDAQQIESSGVQPFELASREEQSLVQARRNRLLKEAVSALKPREQEVLRMRFMEGLGFREMSEKTGTPLSTLQARVEAALKKIRKKIGKEYEEA
jgi:RNA polymerase sigma factor (sigma-70 family)